MFVYFPNRDLNVVTGKVVWDRLSSEETGGTIKVYRVQLLNETAGEIVHIVVRHFPPPPPPLSPLPFPLPLPPPSPPPPPTPPLPSFPSSPPPLPPPSPPPPSCTKKQNNSVCFLIVHRET